MQEIIFKKELYFFPRTHTLPYTSPYTYILMHTLLSAKVTVDLYKTYKSKVCIFMI